MVTTTPKTTKVRFKRVKTPTVLQMEAVECGAAALKIILEYYQKYIPLAELRQVCGISRNGSKASSIVKAAKSYGLEALGFKYELEQVYHVDPPYIVFWNFNHFLVVEGFDEKWAYLSDPALGRRRITQENFDQGYTGVVLTFKPTNSFEKGGIKPNVLVSLYQRLITVLDSATACFILGLLIIVPQVAIPVLGGEYLDEVIGEGRPWLLPILWALGLAAVLNFLLNEAQLRYLRRMQTKLSVEMSGSFLWHLLQLPIGFYAQRFAGEISNRVSYNDSVASTLSGRLATTMIGVVTMVIYGVVLMTYDLNLTIILILLAAVNLVALQWVSRARVDANMTLIQDFGKVAGISISGIQNIETIKATGLETEFFARWAGYYAKANNGQQELGVQSQVLGVLPSFISNIAGLAIIILGGLGVIKGIMTLGSFFAFQQLSKQFLQPVNSLVTLGQNIQEMVGKINRLDDVLDNDIDPEIKQQQTLLLQASITETLTRPKLQGYVEFRQVSFGYSSVEAPLIDNFNLQLKPGQRVALVGATGSGKSTLAKLVTGLYQPTSGEIYFDGQSRCQISPYLLTNSLALVEQDIVLFGGTIRENLTLWDQTISDHDLVAACQDALIHETIVSLPHGYDSVLLEGAANLSGGQRQRLEIARALTTNPSILVMDEATSALDAETERLIDLNLRRRGCTCIIVAHRLSTIRDCEEIIVLAQGKVIQRGTHEQLWQAGGYYAKLVQVEGGGVTL
ncbi:MAG: NHLP family bacteriocin export ABC transporter peptidase/permease/ATPase subunit [Microcystis aeruginosa LG13-03]|nr:NHLP family bacteriocin export ABC transporter peptidase/permease/ATPase subunit [Microcystis aeruginosa LG13-13]NCR02478.1 NHLP family bacteriocin export ABC transporter peptidase/permease/ATPase subunit [Microcystis aeruginosa LG13-03]NCR60677.1 NHLP family bacteriocin export ABC transporter peptidase/permease/ATPase subunit [Microcystis aeruginosa LG11-05]